MGGWLALIEVDDLFGHNPVTDRTRQLLNHYVENALEHSWYDFRMGHKLAAELGRAGLEILDEFSVPDAELSFSGPALPEVVEAWRNRLQRMG